MASNNQTVYELNGEKLTTHQLRQKIIDLLLQQILQNHQLMQFVQFLVFQLEVLHTILIG